MLQIVQGENYEQEADRQHFAVRDIFNRGNIFFEDKDGERISACTLKSGFKLVINPSILKDPEAVYKEISALGLDINKETFLLRASKKTDPYEEIATKVDIEMAQRVKDLNLKGVILEREKWRFYPGGNLASHILGFVGYSEGEDTLEGIYGIEKYYDYALQRKDKDLNKNFFADIFSNLGGIILGNKSNKEGDLVLTIEPSVQANLETELQEISEELKTELAGGIIIDPNTGEIYGMALSPDFDLNNFREAEGVFFGNPLVENVYEMGSIIKAITMAAGLDSGVVTAETTYNDKGSLTLDGSKISNYDGRARGVVEMQEVLNQSLNTGVAFVVSQMGNDNFADYLRKLGFGEETGIDLPNEMYGLISNLNSPRDIEYATASFGQGIALTPIETTKALSALANGGFLITPHLVKEIDYGMGDSDKVFYEKKDKVFKEETSQEITRMLTAVVDNALLGGTVKSENYTIAAKTGTAQIAKKTEKGYHDDKYLHSFFGYFPATNPEFLVFLYVLDPKGVEYASHTLTEPFMDIFKFLVNYYEVKPDREEVKKFIKS
ncbi:MAG: penicillin-binding protein 2 [Patescibacteria group bacterium]|nr:penicillin-binding protein 2 [Patescibacteria group bacterium]